VSRWEVEFTDQFHNWWLTLDEEQQEALAGSVRLLQARGPSLGRPSVDTIASSRHQHMKEIRCPKHGTLRVVRFRSDHNSDLLIGGDKSGNDQKTPTWNAWYVRFVPVADDLYDEHLRLLRRKRAMAGKGRANFDVLVRPIEADPVRAARLADEEADVVGEHLAYSLNEIREQLGITQAELAASMGISQPAISKALHGVSTIAALQRLVQALGGDLELVINHHGQRFLIAV
jgi:plasmid maintenance system antidote protein VapI